jgi:hypothetical protein
MRAIDREMTDSADRNKADALASEYPPEKMRIVRAGVNKEDLLAAQ